MKKIVEKINEIIDLLNICEMFDKANWYQEKCTLLKKRKNTLMQLEEVRDSLAGMGSFLDLSLNPSKEANFSRDEARNKQWELVEELGDLIDKYKIKK